MFGDAMKNHHKNDILGRLGRRLPVAAAALLLCTTPACGGGATLSAPPPNPATTLRQAGDAKGIKIGAAAQSGYLTEDTYPTVLANEFSQIEAEYEMKFDPSHPRPDTDPNPYDFSGGEKLVAFAQAHNMAVRGHTLVWHSAIPTWVTNGHYSAAQLNTILQGHITTVVKHYSGRIYAWDVYNEAFNDDGTIRSNFWYDQPGIGFAGQGTATIEQAFRWARAADANVKLFYNDYSAETVNAKSDAIYAMCKDFLARGVPINGVGFQLHTDPSFRDSGTLSSFAANLKRFADLGLEVQITEFDVRLAGNDATSLSQQADVYQQVAAICAKQKGCTAIQTWGFTDKHSWIPQFFKGYGWALPFDESYNKKPAYNSYLRGLQ